MFFGIVSGHYIWHNKYGKVAVLQPSRQRVWLPHHSQGCDINHGLPPFHRWLHHTRHWASCKTSVNVPIMSRGLGIEAEHEENVTLSLGQAGAGSSGNSGHTLCNLLQLNLIGQHLYMVRILKLWFGEDMISIHGRVVLKLWFGKSTEGSGWTSIVLYSIVDYLLTINADQQTWLKPEQPFI